MNFKIINTGVFLILKEKKNPFIPISYITIPCSFSLPYLLLPSSPPHRQIPTRLEVRKLQVSFWEHVKFAAKIVVWRRDSEGPYWSEEREGRTRVREGDRKKALRNENIVRVRVKE